MRVVHEVTSNQKRILEGAHQFLAGLSRLPDLRNPHAKSCSVLLNEIMKQLPVYNNVGVVKATGNLACSAQLFETPDIFASHSYFKEALRTGAPAVGGYRMNGKSNLVYFYPLVGRSGTVQTVLFVEFGFDWFTSLFVESKLPQGSVLTLRDQSGAILARYPDAEKWVGKAASDAPIYKSILAQKGHGKAEAKGADGILRYYVFTPLGTGSGNTELIVSVGIPKEVLFADIQRTFLRDLTLLFLVGFLTVVGGLVIGEPLIRREVGDLVLATERLRTGDLRARIGPPYSKGELGHLAHAFDRMAEALQKHQIEIVTITQAIRESADFNAALEVALRQICEATGLIFGEAWIPRADGSALESSSARCTTAERLERFTARREAIMVRPGAGLLGRVWTSKSPQWNRDVSRQSDPPDPLASFAREADLKTALGVPIIAKDQVLAVLVFFMSESRGEDNRIVEIVSAVAAQLAWVAEHKRAEQQLRESERRFNAIFNQTYQFVGLLKTDGTLLEANSTALEYRDLEREDVVERPFWQTPWWDTSPGDQERLRFAVSEAAQGKFIRYEAHHRDSNGTVGTFDFSLKPIFDESGRVVFLIAEGRDISDRKRMEEELRCARDDLEKRVQERTADLAESNRALRAEIKEREKTTEELARRHQELLARHRISEIILRTRSLDAAFQEIVDEIGSRTPFPVVAIELYDAARDMMVFKALHGIPFPSDNGPLEIPAGRSLSGIVAHTGQPLVETHAREREHPDEILRQLNCQTFLCVPMKVGQRVVGVLSLASSEKTPVTEDFVLAITGFANHVASLIEHRRAESWLHSLIATTQDAIVSIDRDSRIVLFNSAAEKIFGYTQAEAQGQKVNLLMADPCVSEHDEYIARFERTHESRAIGRIRTVIGRRKNGDVFPIELSLTHIREDEEVPYAALIRDISEKKRLQDQLIENERLAAIGTTSAKLAHEIANPLNGMAMTAKLLERYLVRHGSVSDEKIHSALQTINNEIKRLRTLLEEFRSLYRRENYNFQPTFLSAVIKDVLALEAAEYTTRGIQVKQLCPEDLSPVMADKEKLMQALLNLCRNAAEAMPNGGKLTVRAHSSGDEAILEVEDTGTGIPDGIDILEPFATTKASGTGLGLVIVRQIVAAHKGMLAYASKPDKGAIFRLILPQYRPQIEAAAT